MLRKRTEDRKCIIKRNIPESFYSNIKFRNFIGPWSTVLPWHQQVSPAVGTDISKIHHMIFLRISKTVNILGCTYYNILHTTKLESSSFSSNYQNWCRQISVNSMLIIHDDIKCEGENIYHNLISFLRHLLWELLEKSGERDGAMTMQAHQGEMIYSTNIPLSTGNQNKSRGLPS